MWYGFPLFVTHIIMTLTGSFEIGRRGTVSGEHFAGVNHFGSLLTTVISMETDNRNLDTGSGEVTPASLVEQVRYALGVAKRLKSTEPELGSLDTELSSAGIFDSEFRAAVCRALKAKGNLEDMALTGEVEGAASRVRAIATERTEASGGPPITPTELVEGRG